MPALDGERQSRHRTFDWHVGINIRYLRLRKEIEQKTLAELADMDVTQLSRVENGQRSLKFKEGIAIAQAFGVRPERLTREVTRRVPERQVRGFTVKEHTRHEPLV